MCVSRLRHERRRPSSRRRLLEHLHGCRASTSSGHFRGDDRGWFAAELVLADDDRRSTVERYLADEEGIRAELNTWAAWLETQDDSPTHRELMQHMIGTHAALHAARPTRAGRRRSVEQLCVALCRFLAAATDGVYQVDGQRLLRRRRHAAGAGGSMPWRNAEKYLRPEVIRQVARLDLRAKFIVEGFLAGLHASPFHGFSVEFSEHRKYVPGDDLKDLDWNVYAKTDKYYLKKFEAETNVTGYLVMDLSARRWPTPTARS